MAFLSSFQYEVFISYAWVNNYPEDGSDQDSGWITQFKNRLQPRLDERLGRNGAARIFFDLTSLGHNRDFDQGIEQALQQSATVVAFFSDGYLESPGCGYEMRYFHRVAGPNSGRLFLVRLEDTDRSRWPAEYQEYLKSIVGYRFFDKGPIDGSTVKLTPGTAEFETEFESLRTALAAQLKSMKDRSSMAAEPTESRPQTTVLIAKTTPDLCTEHDGLASSRAQPTVLVAKTTPDLRIERKALASYCASAGLRVLPKLSWPTAAEEFCEAFADALQQSHLFVQLLSDSYTDREPQFPDGIETFQYQQAQQAGLTTLQWRDKATALDKVDDAAHRALLTAADVSTQLPAEFYEDVVKRTQDAFHIDQDVTNEAADAGGSKLVLVRADAPDDGPTERIVQSLTAANIGCRVTQNGMPMVQRLRKIHFDALIVVLGQCRDSWREYQGDELLAVDLSHKDQVPLRAYCLCGERRRLPPYVRPDMLQVVVPDELEKLIRAIQRR